MKLSPSICNTAICTYFTRNIGLSRHDWNLLLTLFNKLLCIFFTLVYGIGLWLCFPYPEALAELQYTDINTFSDPNPEQLKQVIESRLNRTFQEAKKIAQKDAESYAKEQFNVWVNEFQNRLETSGFLDWYFSYLANKSAEDRKLLCSISNFVLFFVPKPDPDCEFFIKETKAQLIARVLKPLESKVDDINNRALGIFYNALSRNLKGELHRLKNDYAYKALSKSRWKEVEDSVASVLPGFRGEAIPAPPSIYLTLIKGNVPGENELLIESELGNIVFRIPKKFRIKSSSSSKEKLKPTPLESEGINSGIELPSEKVLSKAAPQISEMEQLGFDATELASLADEGRMGVNLVKLQALADPLFWIPLILVEGKRYWDLNNSKKNGKASLKKELGDCLREEIDILVEDEDVGLRAVLKAISGNIGTMELHSDEISQ